MKTFLYGKIVLPVLKQIKSGVSPRNLAISAAFGIAVGVVPVLWASTILGIIFGFIFRLNQITLQAVNYSIMLLQYVMIPVYLRLGDKLFGVPPFSLSPMEIKAQIALLGAKEFMMRFSSSIIHGFILWLITAPMIIGVFYLLFHPISKKFHKIHANK